MTNLFREIFLLVGFGSIVWGCYEIYEPCAFIVGGILLLAAGYPRKPNAE